MPSPMPSRLSPPIFLALLATLGIGGAAGGRYLATRPTGPELEPTAPTVDLAPVAPAVDPAPVVPVEPAPVVATAEVAYTGHECDAARETYCAGLKGKWADVSAWCEAQKAEWVASGAVTAINPCANQKYATDSCVEWAAATKPVDPACPAYMDAINDANDALNAACRYTTRKGGVCEGVIPKPADPTAPVKVVPLDDCLEEHRAELSAECQKAMDVKASVIHTR